MFTLAGIFYMLTRQGKLLPTGRMAARDIHTSNTLKNSGGLLEMAKSLIPPLTYDKYKGQAGKICVIGGCQEYTGAPYFAAISALKLGCDLSHVICAKEAAPVIKSYSPELIVHPLLDHASSTEEILKWLPRFHVIVIGPGLGRDSNLLKNVKTIIEKAKEMEIPLVVDADGVFLVTQEPDIIKNYTKAILTPNKIEFIRLFEAVMGSKPDEEEPVLNLTKLCEALGNVTIVKKGENDIISNGKSVLVCCSEGSARRCGGQGDLLSGSMGTFTHWAFMAEKEGIKDQFFQTYGPTICAAYASCLLTRECNRLAFKTLQRNMTCSDMINQIQPAYEGLFCN